MDESAVSTVDMILERHRSSLLPAASSARAVERTSTAASGAASAPGFEESFTSRAPPQRQQEQQQPPPLPPPPPQQTPAVVSLPSAAAAPPATASTEGSPFPQRGKAVVGVGAGVGVPHLPCGRSPPSSTRQTRPHESQPEIVRHEVADLCDTLQFRLRANDRDLESILSRSADRLERLSLSEQGSPAAATSARMAPTGTPPVQQENPTSTAEMISEQASNPVRAASGSSPALPSTDPPAEARRPPVGSDANEGPDRSASAVVSSRKDTPTEARSPLPASDSGAQQTSGVSSPSSFSSPAPEMAEIPTATAQQAARANPGGVSSKQSKLSGTVRGEGGGGDSNAKGGVLDASVSTPQRSTGSDPRYTGAGPGGVDGGYQQRAPGGGRSIHGGGVGRGRDSGGVLNQGTAMGSNSTGAGMPTIATPPQLPRSLADGMIVEAAREAARWLAVDDRTWHQSKKFLDDCMADCPNEKTLNRRGITKDKWWENKVASIKAAILADPSLATCRSVNRSALPMDGWTPLHLAAARGNLRFVEALLESSSVGAFSVDLQGRTALALAAEGGHEDVVKLLKSRMESESADTIVGINAPVDLAGRTPLAWSVRSRARNKQVEPHLYAAGDASVCPTTPAALRSGGGRAAGAGTGAGRASVERGGGGLPCGYADVPGWRIEMEDAVCRHNPIAVVSREPRGSPPPESVSMFGVFDGHGGAFTSKYVSEKLVTCLRSTSGWKLGKRDPQVLCTAIREAFVSCDLQLAREPRMLVTETQNPQSGKRFEARDASGSTAVVALVTPAHAIIANAGDSRAILITVSGAVPGVSSASSNMKSSRIGVSSDVVGGGGGRGNGHGRTPPRVQQPGTDGLGPSWTPPQDSSIGGSDVGDGRDGDFESPVGDSSALNDSVRLEEDDGDEGDGSGEGQDGAGAGDEEGKDGAGRMPHAVTLGDGDEWMGEADDALGALAGTSNGGRQESEDLRCLGKKRVHVRPLSRDHTAANNWEKERVEAAGGRTFVVDYTDDNGESSSVVRTAYDTVVEGQSVMPTRGFGDFYYKQKKGGDGNLLPSEKQVVSACPEVVVHERGSSGDEELLLLACDGVWDVFENQDAGEFFISQLERPVGKVCLAAAKALNFQGKDVQAKRAE